MYRDSGSPDPSHLSREKRQFRYFQGRQSSGYLQSALAPQFLMWCNLRFSGSAGMQSPLPFLSRLFAGLDQRFRESSTFPDIGHEGIVTEAAGNGHRIPDILDEEIAKIPVE